MIERHKLKEYKLKLQKYCDKKAYVKFFRTVCNEEENLSGFILGVSDQFVFIQIASGFMFDGFAIIRLGDFDRIRHSSYERTDRKIFKSEGLLDNGFGFDKELPLTSWNDIFKALKKYDYHVIVQNFRKDYLDFWIGEIKAVRARSVSVHYYNPDGELDEKPSSIKFDSINILTFGDRYSTVFRKYLKPKRK